jgi:hypothetical protein
VIVIEVHHFGVEAPPLEQRMRFVTRAELESEQQAGVGPQEKVRALLAEDAEANARFFREHPKPRDVRARAARLLARTARHSG